jgi:DNA invertase Pin-like site-specific DNA recombinase
LAIGIIRVSSTREREQTILSPDQQRDRIVAACVDRGLELIEVFEELDVSGGTPLAKRHGLRRAIEAVEGGEATVIVAAYFDRLVRSLKVQAELVERVEAVGGQVLALDTGRITAASAGQWLSSTMLGAVSEYARRTTAERVRDAHAQCMADGIPPYPASTAGYSQGKDRRLHPNEHAPAVTEAFQIRAAGGTIADVREHLQNAGVEISYKATQTLLKSRIVLGELHFGDYPPNLTAHEAIVDRPTWEMVQRIRVPQGRKAKSDRLLARLQVLRCGGCGRPMSIGSSVADGRTYFNYRCPLAHHDCPDRQVISARIVEGFVERVVRASLEDAEGHASALSQARADAYLAEQAEVELQRTLGAFQAAGVVAEAGAVQRLAELREARDAAQRQASRSKAAAGSKSVAVGKDWDDLSVVERRGLVRATVASVTVAAGRGERRLSIELVG